MICNREDVVLSQDAVLEITALNSRMHDHKTAAYLKDASLKHRFMGKAIVKFTVI